MVGLWFSLNFRKTFCIPGGSKSDAHILRRWNGGGLAIFGNLACGFPILASLILARSLRLGQALRLEADLFADMPCKAASLQSSQAPCNALPTSQYTVAFSTAGWLPLPIFEIDFMHAQRQYYHVMQRRCAGRLVLCAAWHFILETCQAKHSSRWYLQNMCSLIAELCRNVSVVHHMQVTNSAAGIFCISFQLRQRTSE